MSDNIHSTLDAGNDAATSRKNANSFVFYHTWHQAIINLPATTKEKYEAYVTLMEYGLYGKMPNRKKMGKFSTIVFNLAKVQIDKNFEKRANGHKGGAPKGNQNARKEQNNQKQANVYVNENENENVYGNENVSRKNNSISTIKDNNKRYNAIRLNKYIDAGEK